MRNSILPLCRLMAVAVFCMAGCLGCREQEGAAGGKAKGSPGPARVVELAMADHRPMQRTITATGSLLARERSVLSAKVPGRLVLLNVDVGSRVQKGDLLAQIDTRDYELGVQQAVAALAQARTTVGLPPFGTNDVITVEDVSAVKRARAVREEASQNRERIRNLSASGVASRSELDTAEAAYAVASSSYEVVVEEAQARIATVAERRADLRLAEKRLADASLRAPFDGIVQSRPANPGEYVSAGTPTVELVQSDPLRLRLQVPERDAILVALGQRAQFSIEGDTNIHSGVIVRTSPALDEETRMLFVEADVPLQGVLRPGLFVRAQIIVATNDMALCVPEAAVITFAGLEKVVLVQTNRAVELAVGTGRRQQGHVEVLEGLRAGQAVVLNPGGLRTGVAVEVKPAVTQQTRSAAVSGS